MSERQQLWNRVTYHDPFFPLLWCGERERVEHLRFSPLPLYFLSRTKSTKYSKERGERFGFLNKYATKYKTFFVPCYEALLIKAQSFISLLLHQNILTLNLIENMCITIPSWMCRKVLLIWRDKVFEILICFLGFVNFTRDHMTCN